MKKIENFCPVRDILSPIADKWSLLVMHELQSSEQMRFSQLQRAIPDISQKMLTQTLRKLVKMKLLNRTLYPEVPPRVEYRLTELGYSFMHNIDPLISWAMENRDKCLE